MRSDEGRPNVFAGPHVDRLKFAQADAEAVERAIADGSARLVPVWKSRCPVMREPTPVACLMPIGEGFLAAVGRDDMILLGEYRGLAVFTTEIESESPPPLADGVEFADLRLAAALLPHDEAGLVAYARAMISFRHRHRFCGSCGSPTRPERNGRVMTCTRAECATEFFPRVDPAVIVLVTDGEDTSSMEDILKQARAGTNFADLAKQYSEDPGSKDKGGEYDEVAMGQIDQPHHPEHEREPGGKQGIEAAQQHALDQCIEPARHLRNQNKHGESARGSARRDAPRAKGGPPGSNRPDRRPSSPERYPARPEPRWSPQP